MKAIAILLLSTSIAFAGNPAARTSMGSAVRDCNTMTMTMTINVLNRNVAKILVTLTKKDDIIISSSGKQIKSCLGALTCTVNLTPANGSNSIEANTWSTACPLGMQQFVDQ